MVVQELTAVPYMIAPTTDDEALYGKATLLTDTDLALLLEALPQVEVTTDCKDTATCRLWSKLFALWSNSAGR